MATVKKVFVFVSCILSCIGVLFSLASLSTDHWVTSNINVLFGNDSVEHAGSLRYGLFQGTLRETYSVITSKQLTLTCLLKENVCAFLCGETPNDRYDILKKLYDGKSISDLLNCPQTYIRSLAISKGIKAVAEGTPSRKFINYGVWICTIMFLLLSMLFGFTAALLSFHNTITNPVQVYLSIYGIYVYNAIALFWLILSMLMFGVLFNKSIFHDVAIQDTLQGVVSSDKMAALGYSYWLNIGPLVFYIASICVLYIRHYLISKDPNHKIVQRHDDGDPVIFLF